MSEQNNISLEVSELISAAETRGGSQSLSSEHIKVNDFTF